MLLKRIMAASLVFTFVAVAGLATAEKHANTPLITWSKEVVDTYGTVGQYPHACIGSGDRIHVSYYNASGQLKYATKLAGGKSWTDYVIENEPSVGIHNSITVNSTMVFVAYHNETTHSLMLWMKKISGFDKPIKVVLDNSSDCGQFCKIAVDKLGGVHVVYQDFSTLKPMYLYKPTVGFGTKKILANSGGSGFGMAIDKDNGLHVAINDLSKMLLVYAYKKYGFDWNTVTIDADSKGGCMSSVAVDGTNTTHVSYYDQENKQLKYAIIIEGPMHGFLIDKGVVDHDGDTGRYTSICYDSAGGIHISYMDYTNNRTKHAYKPSGTSTWQNETVDGTSLTGEGTAIVRDSSNQLHIIYYDQGNTNLMMASGTIVIVGESSFLFVAGFLAVISISVVFFTTKVNKFK